MALLAEVADAAVQLALVADLAALLVVDLAALLVADLAALLVLVLVVVVGDVTAMMGIDKVACVVAVAVVPADLAAPGAVRFAMVLYDTAAGHC